ncbi:VWA domain-containing protein [Clostridium bovifaecis]|uniref:VWA domain-containing protein n=1 Tax=Clostridium bovifaecis TaxID=2184719 RepID=A0A6I6F5A3_9CLOT|nr:VWA domain-containing protein [Clostridium bovifaecis]
MDISGSMRKLYKSGVVQNILERIYPLATKFDDDGSLDMWIFSHSFNKLSAVVEENFDTYIEAEILNKKPSSSWGRTEYAPVMEDVISTYKYSKIPAYVIFITDGQNSDKTKTKQALIEASNYPIFWQYVGIGFEEFEFLKRLDELKGRAIDNANFFQLNDIMSVSDEELYNRLLNEFPDWYKEIHKNS